ncbi:MAG: DUF5004 domain-containing protein [bacterium]|nr:DUF5004 domain-containing protein [bacterium]
MKNKIIMGVAMILVVFASCKKDLKEIGAPASKMEGMKASWVLTKAVQVDELSLTKESANVFRYFSGSATLPNIVFSDSTYSVDTVGLKLNFFGSSTGKWSFDNVSFPSKVNFRPDGSEPFTLKLGGPIRPQDNLRLSKEIKVNCKGDESLVMSYVMEFIRK